VTQGISPPRRGIGAANIVQSEALDYLEIENGLGRIKATPIKAAPKGMLIGALPGIYKLTLITLAHVDSYWTIFCCAYSSPGRGYSAQQAGDHNFMELAKPMTSDKRSELQAFFHRSYWTRLWIIQEIAVGSRVSILCGGDILEWEEFSDAILTPLFKHWERDLWLKECLNLCNIRSKNILGAPTSLLEVLHTSSISRSTEPKDKVFGVLGLAFDRRVYLTEPRYGWDELQLCMRMTKSFISRKRSLDIMFIGTSSSSRSLEGPRSPAWTRQLPVTDC
jgi:hypothetical protein